MVNRRLLRIKAMKAIYAFKQTENSDYELTLDFIADKFKPDLNSMEPQNLVKLEGLKKLAILEFEEILKPSQEEILTESPKEAREVALAAFKFYQEKLAAEKNRLAKAVVAEVENIYKNYVTLLLYLIKIAEFAKNQEENRMVRNDLVVHSHLYNNKIVQNLLNSKELDHLRIKLDADLTSDEIITIQQSFDTEILGDKLYKEYCSKQVFTIEDDKAILNHIIKNLILKGKFLKDIFEAADIHWSENAAVLKSLLVKTIEGSDETTIDIQKLAYNWDDDRKFFNDLYTKTMKSDVEMEEVVLSKVKNWDEERVAMMDMIILKMGLTELVNFPSIPVKVTINEYIDIAKSYSTPQSGRFVNGILDSLAILWQAEGKIKKSGRGLIDNR